MELSLGFSAALIALMAAAFYYDLTRYIIPNWLNLTLLALFILFGLLTPQPVDWLDAGLALLAVFGLGFVLYVFKLMGAGDIKMLSALAPWCGFSQTLLQLVLYTAMLGGALAILVYIARLVLPAMLVRLHSEARIPRLLSYGEPIPYGIAISVAFILLLASGKIRGMTLAL